MKKPKTTVAVAIALVLSLIVGMALAGSNGQGVPSAKSSACAGSPDYTPATDQWFDVPGLYAILKTSEPADLIISVTAECALATDVRIKGTGKEETSTSIAQIKIKVLVWIDGQGWVEAAPGDVVFAYRLMMLKGLLWSPSQVDPEGLLALPEQYIEIYEETRTANAFNFILKNVGSGVHYIKVQVMTDTLEGFEGASVAATLGHRTLVVESVRMTND